MVTCQSLTTQQDFRRRRGNSPSHWKSNGAWELVGWRAHLGLGVVLRLQFAADDGPTLVGIDEIGGIVANDTRGRCVDQSLYGGGLAGGDDGSGAVDVDLAEEILCDGAVALGRGGGGVDDYVGLDVLEEGLDLVHVGDVCLVVVGFGVAVVGAAEIYHVDGCDGPAVAGQELVDHMVAEEAVAADDEDLAQVGGRRGLCRHVCGSASFGW